MNTLVIKGGWHRALGRLKQGYARATHDDLLLVEGREQELLGTTEQRLGRSEQGKPPDDSCGC